MDDGEPMSPRMLKLDPLVPVDLARLGKLGWAP